MNKKKSHYIETILFDEKKSRKIVELNAITIALKEVKGSKFCKCHCGLYPFGFMANY